MLNKELPDSLPGLNLKLGIYRIGGSRESYLKILIKFSRNQKNSIEEVKKSISINDILTALRLVHTIKGISGNIGAESMYTALWELESAIKENKRDEWDNKIVTAEKILSELLSTISSITGMQNSHEKKTGNENGFFDKNKINSLLKELKTAIEGYNAKSLKIFESLKEVLAYESFTAELNEIEKHLDKYDFDKALEAILPLAEKLDMQDKNPG